MRKPRIFAACQAGRHEGTGFGECCKVDLSQVTPPTCECECHTGKEGE